MSSVYTVDCSTSGFTSDGGVQCYLLQQKISNDYVSSILNGGNIGLYIFLALAIFCIICYFLSANVFRKSLSHHLVTGASVLSLLSLPLDADYYVPVICSVWGAGALLALVYYATLRLELRGGKALWLLVLPLLFVAAFYNPSVLQPKSALGAVTVDSSFVSVCAVLLLALIVSLLMKCRQLFKDKHTVAADDRNGLLLTGFIVWVLSTLIYFVGTYHHGFSDSLLTGIIRPAINASKTFILGDTLIDVAQDMKENGVYMGMNSVARILAFYVSARLVFRLLGARLRSLIKLSVAHCNKSPLYVFFGTYEANQRIYQSVPVREGEAPLALFIEANDEEPKTNNTFSFGSLVSLFTNKSESYSLVENLMRKELPSFLLISKRSLEKIDSGSTNLRNIGLQPLMRLMEEASRVEFFFMSDNMQSNIASTRSLSAMLNPLSSKKVVMHCHCRLDSTSRLLQFGQFRVNVVDASRLAVDLLHNDPRAMLSRYVDFDALGHCTTPFRALVLGLTNSGIEAVRYLYQFGAFLGSDGAHRSPFCCYVADDKLSEKQAALYHAIPALRCDDTASLVEQLAMKPESTELMDWLTEHIAQLHVIFITMHGDEKLIELADFIHNLALRRRLAAGATKPLGIFVRTRTSSASTRIQLMHDTYKRLYPNDNVELIPLGEPHNIYSYGNVTRHNQIEKAKIYYRSYQEVTRELNGGGEPEKWSERRKRAIASGRLEKLLEFIRMEQQDLNCEFHRRLKVDALLQALHAKQQETKEGQGYSLEEICRYAEQIRLNQDTQLATLGEDAYLNQLLYNLSVWEHLRWNAAHEAIGFLYSKDVPKEYRSFLQQHRCLTDWKNLSPGEQLYDFAVVATTLKIQKNEC